MRVLLGFLLLYLLINLGVIAAGVGIGFLLRRLLPSVDPGSSILIGVVTTGFSLHYFARLMSLGPVVDAVEDEEDDTPPPVVFYPPAPPRSGRKRRRK